MLARAQGILNNDSALQMAKAGLGDGLLVSLISRHADVSGQIPGNHNGEPTTDFKRRATPSWQGCSKPRVHRIGYCGLPHSGLGNTVRWLSEKSRRGGADPRPRADFPPLLIALRATLRGPSPAGVWIPLKEFPSIRVRALHPFQADDRNLLLAVNRGEFALNGLHNRDLPELLDGPVDPQAPLSLKEKNGFVPPVSAASFACSAPDPQGAQAPPAPIHRSRLAGDYRDPHPGWRQHRPVEQRRLRSLRGTRRISHIAVDLGGPPKPMETDKIVCATPSGSLHQRRADLDDLSPARGLEDLQQQRAHPPVPPAFRALAANRMSGTIHQVFELLPHYVFFIRRDLWCHNHPPSSPE